MITFKGLTGNRTQIGGCLKAFTNQSPQSYPLDHKTKNVFI